MEKDTVKIVRIRRLDDYYLGCDTRGRPQFSPVKKEDARVCLSEESATALLGMKGYEDAVVEVEVIEK